MAVVTQEQCIVCGSHIHDSYYKDWAGQCICSSHASEDVHTCHSCYRLCGRNARQIGYGLWLCEICDKGRMTKSQAQGVVSYVLNGLRHAGLGEITGWSLKVSDLDTMVREFNSINVKGFAVDSGGIYTIYILRDLSKLFFANVLAHELLHIWQYRHHLSPPRDLCEGFCNLGSFYVMEHIDGPEAQEIMRQIRENADPVYGEGFRKVYKAYQQGGWKKAVQLLGK